MTSGATPRSLPALLAQLDGQGVTGYRRYEAVRNYMEQKARKANTPISGYFELTPLCNLDCKMCFVHLNAEQMGDARLLNVFQWQDIMQQAIDAGMMYASLTGGECLTYPGFWDLYTFLQGRGVEVSVLTNGLLLDDEARARFARSTPARIQVTLYGASDDAYERVTGHRVFSRVMDNVRRAFEAGLPLGATITPNAYMDDGEELARLLAREGIPFGINQGLMSPRPETGRAIADACLDTYVALAKLRRELTGEPLQPECSDAWQQDGGNDPAGESAHPVASGSEPGCGLRCGGGRSGFAVDWRGGMRPCITFPCQPVNVLSNGMAQAWKHINLLACTFPNPVECEGCSLATVCNRCVAEHAAGAQVGHASPSICAWARRMVAEGVL